MALFDKDTGKIISDLNIISTEDEYWTKWVLYNEFKFPVSFELKSSEGLSIVTKVPKRLESNQSVDLDVKISSKETRNISIECIPHFTHKIVK